jgi:hypothetical protein
VVVDVGLGDGLGHRIEILPVTEPVEVSRSGSVTARFARICDDDLWLAGHGYSYSAIDRVMDTVWLETVRRVTLTRIGVEGDGWSRCW